jgi:hypothetical protein
VRLVDALLDALEPVRVLAAHSSIPRFNSCSACRRITISSTRAS